MLIYSNSFGSFDNAQRYIKCKEVKIMNQINQLTVQLTEIKLNDAGKAQEQNDALQN